MEFKHEPVLLEAAVSGLAIRPDGTYVDGTLGGAGHGAAICERLGHGGLFLGIDRDAEALAAAGPRLERYPCTKYVVHDNYRNIKAILADKHLPGIDGALLDLGVSSYQLDNPERGFSYMQEAPLDMRMDREDSLTAYDVVMATNLYDAIWQAGVVLLPIRSEIGRAHV